MQAPLEKFQPSLAKDEAPWFRTAEDAVIEPKSSATEKVVADLNLNARQQEAVAYVKRKGRITNSEYQQLTGATRKTPARDLDELITKGVFRRAGEKRGSHYLLAGQK